MELDKNYITRKVKYFFDGSEVEFSNNGRISIAHKCDCIHFFIDNHGDNDGTTSVFVDKLDKCGLTGTKLLNSLDKLVKDLNKDGYEIKYSMLNDCSKVEWKSEMYSIDIPLGILKILTKGESWFNSFGYHQQNYEKEKIQWVDIRSDTLGDVLTSVNKQASNNMIPIEEHNDILKKYASFIGITYSGINLKQIIKEGIKLITTVYNNKIINMSLKNLAIFLDAKHRITNDFRDGELFADALIILFCKYIFC